MKNLVIIGLLPLLLTACDSHHPEARDSAGDEQFLTEGRVLMPLTTTSASGNQYRLTITYLDLEGEEHSYGIMVDGQDELDLDLAEGSWLMTVASDWTLERLDEDGIFKPVEAVMTSENPMSFEIEGGETTVVTLSFQTVDTDEEVILQHGDLEIDIVIDEGEAPDEVGPFVEISEYPTGPVPEGLHVTCYDADGDFAHQSCPTLKIDSVTYWFMKFHDNRVSYAVTGYDNDGTLVFGPVEVEGDRYLRSLTVSEEFETVTAVGQGWNEIVLPYSFFEY